MDYKEKYEAALEQARTYYSDDANAFLIDLFPELAESEDERISKAALEGIEHLERNLGWDAIGDIDILDVKEYLEKQKEQKDYRKLYEDIAKSEWFKKAYVGKSLGEDEQKEQKPTEWSQEKQQYFDEILVCLLADGHEREANILKTLFKQAKGLSKKDVDNAVESFNSQPKQEWSEEDKTFVKDAIEAVENYYSKGCGQEELVSWLKSVRPQHKQEWSEEDKKIVRALQHALNCADAQNAITKSGIEVSEVATFLQDLIPSWKPSEEQIEALERTTRLANFGLEEDRRKALVSLYEQLKAL